MTDWDGSVYAMEESHEQPATQFSSTGNDTQAGTLESAESHVTACTTAGGAGNGGCSPFTASFSALVEWGEKNNLIRPEHEFGFFQRPPDGQGDEHQAWFDEDTSRWFKVTYHNKFGVGWTDGGTATPAEYLQRLVLQNKYFGDDIQLVALAQCAGQLRVVTSQPHVNGEAAPYAEIQGWFQSMGFARIEEGGSVAWYNATENLLVADAHEGNVIRSYNGELIPIDLNITQPAGETLQWLKKHPC